MSPPLVLLYLGGLLSSNGANLISANAALSTYAAPGFYVCPSATITASISDIPSWASTSLGFNIIMVSPYSNMSYGTQVFIQSGKISTRYNQANMTNPSYTAWLDL